MTAVVSDERLDELQKTMQRISESGYFVEDATDIIAALTHYSQLRHQQRAAEWRPIAEAPPGSGWLVLRAASSHGKPFTGRRVKAFGLLEWVDAEGAYRDPQFFYQLPQEP